VTKLAVIVLVIGLVACNRKKPEEGREPAQSAVPGPVIGSAAPTAPAEKPAGSAEGGAVGCATQVTLTCEAGQFDGCTSGLTAVHICVAADAKPGQPCAQDVALSCAAGQSDACHRTPPVATNHVCVSDPKTTKTP
jgi:hypothetical protein